MLACNFCKVALASELVEKHLRFHEGWLSVLDACFSDLLRLDDGWTENIFEITSPLPSTPFFLCLAIIIPLGCIFTTSSTSASRLTLATFLELGGLLLTLNVNNFSWLGFFRDRSGFAGLKLLVLYTSLFRGTYLLSRRGSNFVLHQIWLSKIY